MDVRQRTLLAALVSGVLCTGPAVSQPAPGVDEPYFAFVPEACRYLTTELAAAMLEADEVVPGDTNLHTPAMLSQCAYTTADGRAVGFSVKFLPFEKFDVSRVAPLQLDLNATFAAGGVAPKAQLDDPGKVAFSFLQQDRTQLMVVTGIQGPPDTVGAPTELVALYYLEVSSRDHADRLADLVAQARRHLREWLAGGAVAHLR